MYEGRIWVEDHDYTIIRYKGDFLGGNDMRGHYLHFDALRVNSGGLWLPLTVYTEELNYPFNKIAGKALAHARLKAQTRFWNYSLGSLIAPVRQQSQAAAQFSTHLLNHSDGPLPEYPLEQQAQDNILAKLVEVGLLAPRGTSDEANEAVVRKLESANHLHIRPEVHCRELLTTRLEFFTVGHTIVISRGLLDVVPNEPALAAVLALGLARLQLDIAPDKKYAFEDSLRFDPEETFRRLNFRSPPHFRKEIGEVAAHYIANSPYRDSMGSIHKFFVKVEDKSSHQSQLFSANLGDSLVPYTIYWPSQDKITENEKVQDALPLGTRTRVDPWTDELEVSTIEEKGTSSSKEDVPFGVKPIVPRTKRPIAVETPPVPPRPGPN
jgi:hypothetical protein